MVRSVELHVCSTSSFFNAISRLDHDTFYEYIRPKLRSRRQQLGWTQETLAEVAGYALVTVRYWENGTKTPKPQSLDDWMDALR